MEARVPRHRANRFVRPEPTERVENRLHGYGADFAEFYDDHVVPDDREDVPFYRERALGADGPVLELACGTGRIHLALRAAGVEADGFDLSASALRLLYEKADSRDIAPSAWRAAMSAFATDREYALVICPFDAFLHLLTPAAQLRTLRNAHRVLNDDGRFVFDVFVPDFAHVSEVYGEWRTRTVSFRGRPHVVGTYTAFEDEARQVFVYRTAVLGPSGERVFDQRLRLKMLPVREIEHLVERSPFGEYSVAGGFADRDLGPDDAVQTWTLRK